MEISYFRKMLEQGSMSLKTWEIWRIKLFMFIAKIKN